MPGSVSLTGKDVITLNGRVFHDLANGDVVKLDFDGELVSVEAAKDGNIVYGLNEKGKVAKLELQVLLGSSDDRYLNALLASQLQDLSGFVLITGAFVKRVGDGQGNVRNVIYNTFGGVITKIPGAKTSTGGEAGQSVVTWYLTFGNNSRAIM